MKQANYILVVYNIAQILKYDRTRHFSRNETIIVNGNNSYDKILIN